jgi:putative phosphoribosyl transferase
VAPQEAVAELSQLADEVVCLASPTPFHAVGLHYRDFAQTSDEEVVELLDLAAARPLGQGSGPASPRGAH